MPRSAPPLVVSRREENTQRIAALEARADALGLRKGTGIADARAMHPSIEIVEAEPEADRRLLEGIADWCDRYTPLVAIDGDDGIFLDISGCAHLFGGERALLDDLCTRVAQQGFEARAAIASTPGAAWAASRFKANCIVEEGDEREVIAALPLSALRLDETLCVSLQSVGLRTAGALLQTPRAPLARRFGRNILLRLDQALGHVEEVISPRLPVPALSVERKLADPISLIENIERLVLILAKSLCADLERRGEGAERLQLLLFRVDGVVWRLGVGASRPIRNPAAILKLFHERLTTVQDDIDVGYGFELVRLSALVVARLDHVQTDFDNEAGSTSDDIALFADRVRARLGEGSILKPVEAESHVPERAVQLCPFSEVLAMPDAKPSCQTMLERPVRLFDHPDPVELVSASGPSFRWRRTVFNAVRMEGPERIAPEWWRDDTETASRDYYRVEDDTGRRYWVFREIGLRPPEEPPRWFMHGLLA